MVIDNSIPPTALLPVLLVIALDLWHLRLARRDNKPIDPNARGAPVSKRTRITLEVGTAICDYMVAIAMLLLLNTWTGGHGSSNPMLVACYSQVPALVAILRDEGMIKVLRKWIAPQKLVHRTSIADVVNRLKLKIFFAGIFYALVAFDIARFPKITCINDWVHIWVEFMVITLLKDMIGMYFLHEWMHKKAYLVSPSQRPPSGPD